MPMSFPTHESVCNRARTRGVRQPLENETEDDYRKFVASEVGKVDMVEGAEISSGLGWDKQEPTSLLQAMLSMRR